MDILIIVLSVIVSLLLIGVVLIQKSKGGGLSSSFAGSNQIMGVRRTTDFIEKATWTLASVAIASAFFMKDMNQSSESLRTLNQVATPAPVEAKGQYETEAEKAPAAQPAAETKAPAAEAQAPAAPQK